MQRIDRRVVTMKVGLACAVVVAMTVGAGSVGGASVDPADAQSRGNAPASFIIAKLMALSALQGAGLSTNGIEDDGGATAEGVFTTQAKIVTPTSDLTVDLATYGGTTQAKAAYHQATSTQSGPSTSLTNAGDQATTISLNTYLRKGSQVLSIEGGLPAAVNNAQAVAKENGTLSETAISAANTDVQKDARSLAVAIGKHLSGQPSSAGSALTYFPPGAVDPCTVPATSLNHGDIRVASQLALSDTPPSLQCVYTFTGHSVGEGGTGMLAVYTLTGEQAAGAVPPTTVQQAFSGGASSGSGVSTATDGSVMAEGTTAGEVDDAVLLDAGATHTAASLLVRIQDQASSYVVDPKQCSKEIFAMFRDMVVEAKFHGQTLDEILPNPPTSSISGAIDDWCNQLAAHSTR
jgi:hypothetical protein